MAISVLDSYLFKNLFSSDDIRSIFSDSSYTEYLINAETALAKAKAKKGVIPAQPATLITINCVLSKVEFVLLFPILLLFTRSDNYISLGPVSKGDFKCWVPSTSAGRTARSHVPFGSRKVCPLGSDNPRHYGFGLCSANAERVTTY